ncbi:hypothetical protein TNCV_1376491 [Trichonephila clavipes]|nr:hypothetical protein TNCV_1376491 [Trichonephila clavipes]
MAFKQREISPKKGKDLRRPLEHMEMWNEFMCQFRLFQLGYLKWLAYKDCSKTLEDLRDNIRAEIDYILVDMLKKVAQNFRSQLHQCIGDGG